MKDKADPEAKETLKYWSECFWNATGEKYLPTWGRDMKLINDMLAALSPDETRELIKYYFTTEQRIYSLPFFKAQLNELRQKRKKDQPNKTPTKHHVVRDRYE